MINEGEMLHEEDLDIVGKLFGIKFSDGGAPNGLVHLYIEDDENYFHKVTFNRYWINDLKNVIQTIEP